MIGLSYFVTAIGSWVTVLVGIIITSFFFPNMLRKGTVDLLLVKPVHRWALLLYKYIGGLTFIFVCTAYTIVGMWLVLGLRSGLWPNGSLLLIFTITFFFSILYAISTFVGVVTRSTVTAIMLTLMAYALLGGSGIAHAILESNVKKEEAREAMQKDKGRLKVLMPQEQPGPEEANAAEGSRWADSYLVAGSRAVQAVSPRTEDLNTLNTLIISADFMTGNIGDMGRFDSGERNWWVSFLVCILWISIFLGLASLWFTFKDY
jgi:ABC-type transport system involved in multi-copper enzyme maturation permease subunit